MTENMSSEYEFSREKIEKLNNVKMVDKDEETGLELFCYTKCEASDSYLTKQCRGVVFNGNDIVMKAFPYTLEYTTDNTTIIEKTIDNMFNDCLIYDSHEGALVRLFYFSNKWFISTHRKLNAFRSKWASKESFGTLFKQALVSEVENNEKLRTALPSGDENILERFYSILDPTKQYMFLILNSPENRIVCIPPSRPTLYHVGTFINDKITMTEDIYIPYSKKHNFKSLEEMYNYVDTMDYHYSQGVILFLPNNTQFKVLNKNYYELFNARGNEPSIKYRYLQVRMDSKYNNMLYYLYPNMINVFEEYENHIYNIAKNIYKAYVERYIKKEYVSVSQEQFNVIKECHNWHCENRKENRITLEKIISVLNTQLPVRINHMIRQHISQKKTEMTTESTEITTNTESVEMSTEMTN